MRDRQAKLSNSRKIKSKSKNEKDIISGPQGLRSLLIPFDDSKKALWKAEKVILL